MSIRILLFDLDGTLVDTREDIAKSANHAFTAMGLPELAEKQITQAVGRGHRQLFKTLLGENADADLLDEVILKFESHYGKQLLDFTSLYPGVEEALIATRDYLKVVVTNKSQSFAERIIAHFGLKNYFDSVAGAEAFATKKPDPGPLRETCLRYGILPTDAVMIGDSEFDLQAARSANTKCIAALYGFGDPAHLLSYAPDAAIQSMHELSSTLKNLS